VKAFGRRRPPGEGRRREGLPKKAGGRRLQEKAGGRRLWEKANGRRPAGEDLLEKADGRRSPREG
jgi:hypothetical protein